MICVTTSLMSMEDGSKKQYFILNYSRNVVPYDPSKQNIENRLSLCEFSRKCFYKGCCDAEKYGKIKVLLDTVDKKQFLAKISLLRIDNKEEELGYLVKVEPWDKVKLWHNIQ